MEARIAELVAKVSELQDGLNALQTEKKIADLTAKVDKLQAALVAVMKGPLAQMKLELARAKPLLDAWDAGQLKTATPTKRRPTNKADWQKVMNALNAGGADYKAISEATGIPQSTCRNYAKMTEEDVAKLPEGVDE